MQKVTNDKEYMLEKHQFLVLLFVTGNWFRSVLFLFSLCYCWEVISVTKCWKFHIILFHNFQNILLIKVNTYEFYLVYFFAKELWNQYERLDLLGLIWSHAKKIAEAASSTYSQISVWEISTKKFCAMKSVLISKIY